MSVKIIVNNNGSLRVEGEVQLLDAAGKEFGLAGRDKISLCRCGLSSKKPFCDGAHRNGFEHTCEAYDLTPLPKP